MKKDKSLIYSCKKGLKLDTYVRKIDIHIEILKIVHEKRQKFDI